MNIIKKIIPAMVLAVPLMGMASAGTFSHPGMTVASVQADSDSIAKPVSTGTVIDEVIWVVGDEAILKSDVEAMRMQAAMEGVKWSGDPDCTIPEQIAVQKLFKHQAIIDSIEVTDADVAAEVEQQINYWLEMVDGSRERLEEYKHQPLSQIRNELRDEMKDRQMVQRMKRQLTEDIAVTPAEVRRYFKDMPEDSIPFVPTEVEVQIIQQTPRIDDEELNRVKDELRGYTDRVNRGEATFQTLARLYSEDPGTARRGGEVGLAGRGTLDPAFATVAFNLTDPKKVSKIVESEFGFHIIQLIEKRGEKVNVRHILRKPVVSDEAIKKTLARLDSIAGDLREGKFTFDDVANAVADKLVHRHPHVFGDTVADDPATVLRNWERIKQSEHRKEERRSALDGVPSTLPALLKARRTMEKAARVGYTEDIKPLPVEGDPGEFLLRAVKSVADLGVDAEAALEKTVAAFAARFRAFEDARREK